MRKVNFSSFSVDILCVKNVCIRSFSGPYFPAFKLRIQPECGKKWIRKIPNTDTFHAVSVPFDTFF